MRLKQSNKKIKIKNVELLHIFGITNILMLELTFK